MGHNPQGRKRVGHDLTKQHLYFTIKKSIEHVCFPNSTKQFFILTSVRHFSPDTVSMKMAASDPMDKGLSHQTANHKSRMLLYFLSTGYKLEAPTIPSSGLIICS